MNLKQELKDNRLSDFIQNRKRKYGGDSAEVERIVRNMARVPESNDQRSRQERRGEG